MANGLHEYENWLTDHIDPFIQISGNEVVLTFGDIVSIDIASCKDLDGIIVAANQLRNYIENRSPTKAHPSLPDKYLLLHLCGLIIRHNGLRLDVGEVARQIDELWGGYDWQNCRWPA